MPARAQQVTSAAKPQGHYREADKEVARDKIEDAFERQVDLEAEEIQVRTEGHRVIL
jgi:osmotically-inducible protein OsmY